MLYAAALVFLPPLLVFALYHLSLWVGVPGMRRRGFWRRVAFASALAHVLIVVGLALLAWIDDSSDAGMPVSVSGDLWAVLWVLDPVAMAVLAGILPATGSLALPSALITLLGVGTLQWYWVGGALGAAFERVWRALRTPGDDLPDWF